MGSSPTTATLKVVAPPLSYLLCYSHRPPNRGGSRKEPVVATVPLLLIAIIVVGVLIALFSKKGPKQ